ncbi:MAG: hypothetical protein JWN56_864 [Sphingobacteriales bacterium]|nr:hypothetical protein [Sphingobacteriales bacterium]
MKNILLALTVIGAAFLAACEKNISVKQPAYSNRVSIQGFIEPDSIPILYFNATVPYFDKAIKKNQLVIRNAVITLQSNLNIDVLSLDSVFDKIDCQFNYFYKGNKKILSNTAYTLTIKSGNEIYTANATTNIEAPVIDSISYTSKFNDLYGEHEGVLNYFKDVPNQVNYYRFEMIRLAGNQTQKAESPIKSACLGTDSVEVYEIGRAVFNDIGNEGKSITIVAEPAYSHKKGTEGQIAIQAIDKSAYEFFSQLDRQKLAQFNPFVEPVFLQDGQFGKKAIGFFSAKKNSERMTFTYPE